jgi:hypothetical protein
LTQATVSGTVQVTGDFIAQKFIEKKENFDKRRSMNFLIIGCFSGLVLRKWFGFMDRKFKDPRKIHNAVKKVAGEDS